MRFKFNPTTGRLDLVDSHGGGGGDVTIVGISPIVVTETTPGNFEIEFDNAGLSTPILSSKEIAGETGSALKLVYVGPDNRFYVAAPDDSFSKALVLGMARTAFIENQETEILVQGIVEDPSFSFSPNQLIYLGPGGTISNAMPSNPGEFRVVVGKALTTTKIFLQISEPITI